MSKPLLVYEKNLNLHFKKGLYLAVCLLDREGELKYQPSLFCKAM